jgi:hypothetical protein
MLREIVEKVKFGQKFHPIDVFFERWVITDGKQIFTPEGEVISFETFKKEMKKSKIYNQHDHRYFPTEKLAKEGLKDMGSSGRGLVVKKLSYH